MCNLYSVTKGQSAIRDLFAVKHDRAGNLPPLPAIEMARSEIRIHHHIAGPYLNAYASEMAWREDNRRISNGEQFLIATNAALAHPVSRQWKGYWQRAKAQP